MARIDTGFSEEFTDFVADQRDYKEFVQQLRQGKFDATADILATIPDGDPRQSEIHTAAKEGFLLNLKDGRLKDAQIILDAYPMPAKDLQKTGRDVAMNMLMAGEPKKADQVIAMTGISPDFLRQPETHEALAEGLFKKGHWPKSLKDIVEILDRLPESMDLQLDDERQAILSAELEEALSHLAAKDLDDLNVITTRFHLPARLVQEIATKALRTARVRKDTKKVKHLAATFGIDALSPAEHEAIIKMIEWLKQGKGETALDIMKGAELTRDMLPVSEVHAAALEGIAPTLKRRSVHGAKKAFDTIENFFVPKTEWQSIVENAFRDSLIEGYYEFAEVISKKLGLKKEFEAHFKERVDAQRRRGNHEGVQRIIAQAKKLDLAIEDA